jgi:conjugative relaxase-like TrwC/TraI family protein
VAIALKKLSAGSGYEYLTRTVAALDATGRGHTSLVDYYTAKGETPGTWWGAGLAGVGLAAGDRVGEEQMKLLFGAGLNPTTGEQLGRRYSVFGNEPTPFEAEVARRLQAWQDANGGARPGRAVCRQVRTGLGREWFTAEHGVPPEGPRELHGFIAKATSHPRVAVAGFDATFSPPKSVSALWALAPRPLAAAIRAAHEAAVTDALAEAEQRVLFTRTGHKGARNVPVTGMIAARFDHRDSRTGDPDLHTHVAIANKVRTDDGHWMTIDATVLYAAKVTLSEVYLTSLTARLRDIGLTLVPVGKEGKRPVFEIAGVDPRLNARWSSRRHGITAATSSLVAQFEADHERPPTPIEKLDLAQQATLDTRPGKHQPRSEADQRATWAAEAEQAVGQGGLDRLLHAVWSQPRVAPPVVDEAWISHTAQHVLTAMEADRSSWTPWNVRSEALRQVRAAAIPLNRIPDVVDRVVGHALTTSESVPIRTRRAMPVEPDLLRRPDTTSMYDKPSATRYTSRRILWAERRLIDTAGRLGGRLADHNSVTMALLQSWRTGNPSTPASSSWSAIWLPPGGASNSPSPPPEPGRPPPCAPSPPPGPAAAAISSASHPPRPQQNNSAPNSAQTSPRTTWPNSCGPSTTTNHSPPRSGPTPW